jgi:glycerol-3-phosphate dehydrogenase (NAD(P)+)
MYKRIAIIGAGSWGMAVADLLHANGHSVILWEHNDHDFRLLKSTRANHARLKNFTLPSEIDLTQSLEEAVKSADLILLTTPSQFVRGVLESIKPLIPRGVHVVTLAKGIENGTLKRMSEVIAEVLHIESSGIAVISGPSHAEEVAVKAPTAVVVASTDDTTAIKIQELFSNNYFRVYKSDDVIGVELGGALKNIIAIATGITDGLGMGDNTKGALITRGLAEITRLGVTLGARAETFAGLSGIGDLVTTCVSRHSRNRFVGEAIGKGQQLDDILSRMTMVAEGVATTRSGYELSMRYSVEMPITRAVYQVLFENKPPADGVAELMGRRLKAEVWR